MSNLLAVIISEKRTQKELNELWQKSLKDPHNIRLKIRIGELQYKLNKREEAIRTYLEAARDCARKGFYRQALALNKVVQRLDSSRAMSEKELDEISFQRDLYLHTFLWKPTAV